MLLQHHKIARAARTKTEIIPHLQPAHAQAAHQHAFDKIQRGDLRKCVIKTAHVHMVNAARTEQFQLVAQRSQTRGRLVRREKLAWLRLEDHHARGHIQPLRGAREFIEHRPMAQMHAIKIAYGESHRGFRRRRRCC